MKDEERRKDECEERVGLLLERSGALRSLQLAATTPPLPGARVVGSDATGERENVCDERARSRGRIELHQDR
jgi:hypothetical protein